MPRIANVTNFDGQLLASQPWVMQQISNINAGTTNVFVKDTLDKQQLDAYISSLSGVQGNIVIIESGTAKGSYIFIDNLGKYKTLGSGQLSGQTLQTIENLTTRLNVVQTDFGSIVTKTINGLTTTYKIKNEVLPQIAITRVYTIDASKEGNTGYTVLQLISSALGNNSVQTGDLIIITTKTPQRLDVAGNYVITRTLTDPAQISQSDYVKLYVGGGSVATVNGKAPVGGNVQLSINDLDGIVITKQSQTINDISINDVSIAFKSSVQLLSGKVTELHNWKDEVTPSIESINNISLQQEKNIQAIQKSVQLIENTLNLINGQNGVQIIIQYNQTGDKVKSYTVQITVNGRVLQVWDTQGKMIIPDIIYNKQLGTSKLKAKYNGQELKESSWTILRTQQIIVQKVDDK